MSNRDRAVEANSAAVLRLLEERDALAKAMGQSNVARKDKRLVKVAATQKHVMRAEADVDLRHRAAAVLKRKQLHREHAERQRLGTGASVGQDYIRVPGEVVLDVPKKRRTGAVPRYANSSLNAQLGENPVLERQFRVGSKFE